MSGIGRGWCPLPVSCLSRPKGVVRSDAGAAHRLLVSGRVLSAVSPQVKAYRSCAFAATVPASPVLQGFPAMARHGPINNSPRPPPGIAFQLFAPQHRAARRFGTENRQPPPSTPPRPRTIWRRMQPPLRNRLSVDAPSERDCCAWPTPRGVITGLVPVIHVLSPLTAQDVDGGTSPAMAKHGSGALH